MNIFPSFPGSRILNITKGGYASRALLIVFLILAAATACSYIGTAIPGTEHLECSPDVHFIRQSMTCTKQPPGDWPYQCSVSGTVENSGSRKAANVSVLVEFGPELNGVRNTTVNLTGDLGQGEKADFKNEIPAYQLPTEYDISIKCMAPSSDQSAGVPSQTGPLPGHGPEGIPVSTLAIDPVNPANLYAGTTASGLFISTDGGVNWTVNKMGVEIVQVFDLAIDPFTPTTIYAAIIVLDTGYPVGALYKSIDGGQHWFSISEGMGSLSVGSIKIDPLRPSTIYAVTENGLIKSMDGGEHWQTLNLGAFGPYVHNLVMDPLTPSNLYAASAGHGVIKSTNGGEKWSEGGAGLTNLDLTTLVIDPVTPTKLYTISWMGVFQTTDAAMSWIMVNPGPIEKSIISALAIDPVTPSILYAAFYEPATGSTKIMKSTDEGKNWDAFDVDPGTSYISSIVIDPATPTLIYLLTNDGLVFMNK